MEEKKGHEQAPLLMLIAIFLGYSSIYIDKTVIGMTVVTIANDLGIDPSQKGLILSAFFLGYTLLQIPFGFLANKIGTRKVLISSIVLVGLFMILFGFGFSLLFLVAIRFFSGAVAHSGYPSSVSTFISQELPQDKRGPTQSAMIASSGFAAFVGPLIVAPLLTSVGWHKTYYFLGVAVLGIALFMYVTIPKSYGGVKAPVTDGKQLAFRDVLKDRNVWVIIISAFFINATLYGLTGWLASYLNDVFQLELNMLAIVTAIIGIAVFIAALLGGVVVNKYLLGKEKQAIFIMATIGGILVYLVSLSTTFTQSMILLILAVSCASFSFTTLISLPVKIWPSSEVSVKYATINAIGVSGGFFAPTIIGALVKAQEGGFEWAFIFIALTCVLSGLTALFINRPPVGTLLK